jgi:hypothetical protein
MSTETSFLSSPPCAGEFPSQQVQVHTPFLVSTEGKTTSGVVSFNNGRISLSSWYFSVYSVLQKKNTVVLVRKRTIPPERPPLVGEVSANFCG